MLGLVEKWYKEFRFVTKEQFRPSFQAIMNIGKHEQKKLYNVRLAAVTYERMHNEWVTKKHLFNMEHEYMQYWDMVIRLTDKCVERGRTVKVNSHHFILITCFRFAFLKRKIGFGTHMVRDSGHTDGDAKRKKK